MSSPAPPIPVEVHLHIISLIPPSDTQTLARLLRVDKQLFSLTAPALYTHITTPNPSKEKWDLKEWFGNFVVDTGLPPGTVDISSERKPVDGAGEDDADDSLSETDSDTRDAPATLKSRLFGLTRTFTVYERQGGEEIDVRDDLILPNLDTLILKAPGSAAIDQMIDTRLCPRVVISTGVSLHSYSSIGVSYHLDRLEERYVLVEPSDPKPSSGRRCGKTRMFEQGLEIIQKAMNGPLSSCQYSGTGTVTMTYILVTPPNERYEVPQPFPHSGMMMTMEFSPEYAPGWMHAFTRTLGPAVAELVFDELSARKNGYPKYGDSNRKPALEVETEATTETDQGSSTASSSSNAQKSKSKPRSKPLVRFVNFGVLSGSDVGMPQAATSEIMDRLRRGLKAHIIRGLHRPPLDQHRSFHPSDEEMEEMKAKLDEKIVWEEMDDWLRGPEARGREADHVKLGVLKWSDGEVGDRWARRYDNA